MSRAYELLGRSPSDGSRKRVNYAREHLDGVRMNPDAAFHEINTRIIVR